MLTFKIEDQKYDFEKRGSEVKKYVNRGTKIAFKPKI